MQLTKNGVTVTVDSPLHIQAYKASGWVEAPAAAVKGVKAATEPAHTKD